MQFYTININGKFNKGRNRNEKNRIKKSCIEMFKCFQILIFKNVKYINFRVFVPPHTFNFTIININHTEYRA